MFTYLWSKQDKTLPEMKKSVYYKINGNTTVVIMTLAEFPKQAGVLCYTPTIFL